MGCCSSRHEPFMQRNSLIPLNFYEQETSIQKVEKLLPFADKDSDYLIKQIVSKGKSGQNSPIRQRRMAINLGLDPSSFTSQDSNTSKALSLLKSENPETHFTNLSLFALLIGKGTETEKARLLIELLSDEESVQKERFLEIIEEMVIISSFKIPQMAVIYEEISQEEFEEYTSPMVAYSDKLIYKFCLNFFGPKKSLTKDELLQSLEDSSLLGKLFSPKKIRNEIKNNLIMS